MKNEFVTAMGTGTRARPLDARPAGGGRFTTAKISSLRVLGAFAALLFLAPLVIGEAEGACESNHRLSHSEVDCLHAWWDNTPSASTGVPGGSTVAAISNCSIYGTVVAKIDIRHRSDWTWHLENSSTRRGKLAFNDIRGVSCCRDISDLCLRRQVEANPDGRIVVYNTSSASYDAVDVSTRIKRYEFCQDNPDNIYCVVDPKGDAYWEPNCGDHDCTMGDCSWQWNKSDAAETCTKEDMGFSGHNFWSPQCDIATNCRSADGSRSVRSRVFVTLWDMDDLQKCDDLRVKLNC